MDGDRADHEQGQLCDWHHRIDPFCSRRSGQRAIGIRSYQVSAEKEEETPQNGEAACTSQHLRGRELFVPSSDGTG